MSWLYLPEVEGNNLPPNISSTGVPSATLNGSDIVSKSLKQESKMDSFTMLQFGEMSAPSRSTTTSVNASSANYGGYAANWLLQVASHASHLAWPVANKRQMMIGMGGRQPFALLKKSAQHGYFWRTLQDSLPGLMDTLASYSKSWPKAGMMSDGVCYRRPNWGHRINVIESGLLPTILASAAEKMPQRNGDGSLTLTGWAKMVPTPVAGDMGSNSTMRKKGTTYKERMLTWPTPSATTGGGRQANPHKLDWKSPTVAYRKDGSKAQISLETAVRKWPTPSARDYKATGTAERFQRRMELGRQRDLNEEVIHNSGIETSGGQLNPAWVEWLMGWPIGWTGLEPVAMDKFLLWRRQHGIYLRTILGVTNEY